MPRLNTERLQRELFKCGMKQRELAMLIGVTEVTISRYINETRQPRYCNLVEMAKALRTTPEYLTDSERNDTPSEAFNKVKVAIETYGDNWFHSQKKELIDLLVDMCAYTPFE